MPLELGTALGHYDVTALIGEGGMGQVYQATDTGTVVGARVSKRVRWPTSVYC